MLPVVCALTVPSAVVNKTTVMEGWFSKTAPFGSGYFGESSISDAVGKDTAVYGST